MASNFNPELFLDIAKKLLNIENLDEKGKFRTSIGRAYYSAFLLVRIKLERKGKRFGTEAQHKEVRDFLKIILIKFLADLLKALFDYQVDADYYLTKSVNKLINRELCERCITIAEEIINNINVISS